MYLTTNIAHHPMDLFTLLNQLFGDLIQGGSDLFKLGANSAQRRESRRSAEFGPENSALRRVSRRDLLIRGR